MSNDAFIALPALLLVVAVAMLILAFRGFLAPGAAFNAVAGIALTILMAVVLSGEGGETFDGRVLAEVVAVVLESAIALTNLTFFLKRVQALAVAVRIGVTVHVILAAGLLAFAIAFSTADFAWR